MGEVTVSLLQDHDHDHQTSQCPNSGSGASVAGAVFNISTTMIGAGIMSIPATFKVLGVFPALLVISLVALIGDVTGAFLLRYTLSFKGSTNSSSSSSSSSSTTSTSTSTTYAALMAESFGPFGSLALQLSVIFTCFGCLVIYLIIIGDVLTGNKSGGTIHTGILQEWFGFYWWTSRSFALLLVVLLFILPLVLLRRVDSLRYTSALSILLALVFVAISSIMAFQALLEGKTQNPKLMPDFSSRGAFFSIFTTIPVFMTAFGFQINVHQIRAELAEPSDMRMAIRISLIICAAFYFSIGFFGYLLFGDSINADLLVNFDQYSDTVICLIINAIVRLSYAFHLMLVFPLLNYALRANIDELLFPNKPELAKDTTRFVYLTCILLTLAYVIAIAIPSIWYCFQILGSTTAVCIILIFPSSIMLRDVHGISTTWDKVVAVVLILTALATSTIAIWTNLSTSAGSEL